MVDEAPGIVDFPQAGEAIPDDFPPLLFIGDACLPHGTLVHAVKYGICEFEHIGQAFFRPLPTGAKDFLAIDVVLRRLEFGGGEVWIGRIHRSKNVMPTWTDGNRKAGPAFSSCHRPSLRVLRPLRETESGTDVQVCFAGLIFGVGPCDVCGRAE